MEVSGSASCPSHFTILERTPVPIEWWVGWAPGPVWAVLKRGESLIPAGMKPWILWPVAYSLY